MKYTGTLIEDLFATVERVEQQAQVDNLAENESWFATVQENSNYDSNLLRWPES